MVSVLTKIAPCAIAYTRGAQERHVSGERASNSALFFAPRQDKFHAVQRRLAKRGHPPPLYIV